ncbi:glycosyltransferase [Aquicoccus sp. SCR17]|nr:glycosyltransferase [Carideicomes alvinocaridis]
MSRIAAIAIGRNEGARLERCLTTLRAQVERVVYVDSGSTDGSVALAERLGAQVVALDMSQPFTAARARNAGFDALRPDLPPVVQFVDGDCGLAEGWIAAGLAALDAHPDTAMVTGWRREIHPEASLYNRLCDHEWHRPAGVIETCGGDMMLRSEIFDALGGMDPRVIAAEDDELCVRMRKAGWVLRRIPHEMTRHDAAMTRFSQWWRRAVRSGHGFAQVGHLHPEYFRRERRRTWLYAALVPGLVLLALLTVPPLALLPLLAYAWNWWRTTRGLKAEGLAPAEARRHAGLITLSKFPNLIGMIRFHLRRLTGRAMRIIEYK